MSKKNIKNDNNLPIVAICYDFDKTLSPDNMQEQGYIQAIGYERASEFWDQSSELAKNNDMDQNLAYMYMMLEMSRGKVLFTKETLNKKGADISFFPGVVEWFERIRQYGKEKGVRIMPGVSAFSYGGVFYDPSERASLGIDRKFGSHTYSINTWLTEHPEYASVDENGKPLVAYRG